MPKKKTTSASPSLPSWRQLAGMLQTTDRSLRLWRARPGAPQAPDEAAWRVYMEEQNLGRTKGAELADIRRRVELQRLRRLTRENDQAEEKLLPLDELCASIARTTAAFVAAVRFTLETEMPARLVGQPIAQIRVEMMGAVDRLLERYNHSINAKALTDGVAGGTEQPISRPVLTTN
jgi:hypothetical protein